ncbi:MAG: NADH-quinone oxidoreductase subunit L, partial [Deltaproteobacteria bacterium]|nr:NADH-quinone oxidoreductase subunit L [Deltaproteobacteria bacterium]
MRLLTDQFPASDFTPLALIVALPLLGALLNGLFGKRLGKSAVTLMALVAVGGSFLAAVAAFVAIAGAPQALVLSWQGWQWFAASGRIGQAIPIDV